MDILSSNGSVSRRSPEWEVGATNLNGSLYDRSTEPVVDKAVFKVVGINRPLNR